jgi:hypothetical protein
MQVLQNRCQQPKSQPTPRRTELRHGVFPGGLSAVRLGLQLPSIVAEGGFFLGAAQRRRGGRRGGNAPAPANFAQLLGGRGSLGLPQEGQMGQ